MKYGFFPGCNMPAIRPDVEKAIRLSMPRLGVELEEMEGYVCCPAYGTFHSSDEEATLAVSGWNLSIAEQKGLDVLVECGSCYSSLRMGKSLLEDHERKSRVDELLKKAEKKYEGKATVRHMIEVLYRDVGVEKIKQEVKRPLEGVSAVIQYPCHTVYPSDIVGFDPRGGKPYMLGELVEALGAKVEHFSCEYQCCGGAGGFHRNSAIEAAAFAKRKLDAIKAETGAKLIVVSCITCLMFLDSVQKELNSGGGSYSIPVFDYNQILSLCMGFPAEQVAAIATTPRDEIVKLF
ncbi:MAG: CoB--CoM heterodisulfide reductase iron-sulfur subunit B family protein [Deltaproteobacteria bacterium]|nr:CoB--CoM heterodisulfide reductase iron-sulfur subunit B family protein [Deltaproteobacteria bacterium]